MKTSNLSDRDQKQSGLQCRLDFGLDCRKDFHLLGPTSHDYPSLQEEELARKKSAAYAKMDKKEEPIALPFNAIFEDEVEELYKDLDKRRHAMSVANRAVSAFGNTPGLKWGPPIYDRFKLPS